MSSLNTSPKTVALRSRGRTAAGGGPGGKKTPATNTSTPKPRRVVDAETAKVELQAYGLAKSGKNVSLDDIVELLVDFSAKDGEGADDAVELLRAIGYTLKHEMVLQTHPGLRIDTRWVPGHEDVEGNEKADRAAKEAGEGIASPRNLLPAHLRESFPINPTSARRVHRQGMQRNWATSLEGEPRTERMRNLDPTYPSLEFFERARDLPRSQFSVLTQLRTGHYPTTSYLYRFGKAQSPDCPRCGKREETVLHCLVGCDATVEQRRERAEALGPGSNSLRRLLTPGRGTKHVIDYLRHVRSTE